MRSFWFGLVLATSAAVTIAVVPATAATCSDKAVSARGEPASLRIVARIKAIGNWRSRVRTMNDLGPNYDNWRRSQDKVERCIANGSNVVCTVTAKPCRR